VDRTGFGYTPMTILAKLAFALSRARPLPLAAEISREHR
jgi:hypothetical protein